MNQYFKIIYCRMIKSELSDLRFYEPIFAQFYLKYKL